MEIFSLSSVDRRLRAIRLLSEAREKLGAWRKDAVEQMLLRDGAIPSNPPAEHVAAAAQLLHEHEDNTYNRLRIRRRQLLVLGLCAMALLGVIAVLVPSEQDQLNRLHWRSLLYFASVGALGASISGLMRVGEARGTVRIPDELGAFAVLIGRLAVGAAVAIFVIALWRTDFFTIAGVKTDSPMFAFAIAFVAGFSERLAQGAVDRIAGSGGQEPRSTSTAASSRN
jgi:hypothetical protein